MDDTTNKPGEIRINELDVVIDLEERAKDFGDAVDRAQAAVNEEAQRVTQAQTELAAINAKIRTADPTVGAELQRLAGDRHAHVALIEALEERVKAARAAVVEAQQVRDAAALEAQRARLAYNEKCVQAQANSLTALVRRFDAEIFQALNDHEDLWNGVRRLSLSAGNGEPKLTPWVNAAQHARAGSTRLYRFQELARALDGLDDVERASKHRAAQEAAAERRALAMMNGTDGATTDPPSRAPASARAAIDGSHRTDA